MSHEPQGGLARAGLVLGYRLCLTALPRDVRRTHGTEMVQALCSLVDRRVATRGRGAGLWLWAMACGEAVREGIGERLRRRREEGWMMMTVWSDFWQDVRLAVRALGRKPAQTLVLLATLGLGVGATTSIFSILNGVLFQPLPYPEAEELVAIRHAAANVDGAGLLGVGGADILDYQAGTPSLEAMGALQVLETNLNDDQGAARIALAWTTPDFFHVLGVQAALGRVLRPDDWAGADRARMEDPSFTPPPMAVVLDHDLWVSRFGSDPDILGRSIRLNGQSMTILGVLPSGFELHLPADEDLRTDVDAWALMPVPLSDMGRGSGGFGLIGRMRDGATLDQVRAGMERVAERLRTEHEAHSQLGTRVVVDLLHPQVVGRAGTFLWVLFGAVGMLLLIACLNVANLLLVRSTARMREFAVRAALGVGRGRLTRQLVTEGLVLSVLGTALGVALARWAVTVLVTLAPPDLPRAGSVALDGTVLWFAAGLTGVVALLFGLTPLFAANLKGSARTLLSGRASGEGTRANATLRRLLIVGELAVSVILVAGTGLLLRSFGQLRNVELGIEPDGVVAMDLALPFFAYRQDEARTEFFVQLAERANQLPGVVSAGVTPSLPLEPGGTGSWLAPFAVDGSALGDQTGPRARYRTLTPGALEALGIDLLEGRSLRWTDERTEGLVPVIVDSHFAESHLGSEPLGSSITLMVAGYTGQNRVAEGQVVGITEPARFASVAEPDQPTIFLPYRTHAPVDASLVLRTETGDAAGLAAGVRALVAELDPDVPLFAVRPFRAVVNEATAQARYLLFLVGLFAILALVLAAVGLYGVVSTLVQQRTREIGVRIAHGAKTEDISRMFIADGLRLILPGLALGLGGAVVLTPVIRSLLFQVSPLDPAALVGTTALLGLVALVASLVPATRAARVDPVRALREE